MRFYPYYALLRLSEGHFFRIKGAAGKGGVGLAATATVCTGCICAACAKSEHSGAVYACPVKPCKACDTDTGVLRRSYCLAYVAVDTGLGADELRL